MEETIIDIQLADIILDESIYPRKNIDHKRVHVFEENLRDGFSFDPIQVQACSDQDSAIQKIVYRVLDGAHRWTAFKNTGRVVIPAIVKTLDGADPLLYAAKQAIGPRQLTEAETRHTERRAFKKNPRLTSVEIGKAIGRARQTVDNYIADLRAVNQMGMDIKIFRMNRLGIPQDRIAERLCLARTSFQYHLPKMPVLANSANSDLHQGFTISQVAQKHGLTEPMVWSLALEGKDDQDRFREIGWGLRTWDQWNVALK